MDFRARSESDLASLNDDDLIDHISQAREAADVAQMRAGIGVLTFRRIDMVRAKIQLKVDKDEDVEDLTMTVLTNALTARFEGEHMGEFVNMLHTITQRRIADFYSRKTLDTAPLAEENEGEDETFGERLSVDGHEDPVLVETLIRADLGELSETHRRVVALYLDGLPADGIAERVNQALGDHDSLMTAPNVHQITKRFRDRMRLALGEDS